MKEGTLDGLTLCDGLTLGVAEGLTLGEADGFPVGLTLGAADR